MITNGQTDLLELIQNASEMAEGVVRMDAVRKLKRRSLARLDALALSEFARKAEDPAWRTTAAQVLGFHRVAAQYSDLVDALTGAATSEQDPDTRRALAYAVRGTDGAADLVDHPVVDVALEAVDGLPATEAAVRAALDAYFSGLAAPVSPRLLRRISGVEGAGGWVVDYLLEASFDGAGQDPTERALALFAAVDQGEAFASLVDARDGVERTHEKIWPGLARRERKRVLVDLYTQAIATRGIQPSLAGQLADHALRRPDFLAATGRVLRTILRGMTARDGEQLILYLAHAFDQADREGKGRLAGLMLVVGKEIEGTSTTVGSILQEWADAPPEMTLKIRQLRMGIR